MVKLEIIVIQVITKVLHITCNLNYSTPKEIPLVFHNWSKYDYHFIITELATEFEGEFSFLGEIKEKYRTLSVSVKKEVKRIGEKGKDIIKPKKKTEKKPKILSYKLYTLKFIIKSCW